MKNTRDSKASTTPFMEKCPSEDFEQIRHNFEEDVSSWILDKNGIHI